jgi:hypothetical protein
LDRSQERKELAAKTSSLVMLAASAEAIQEPAAPVAPEQVVVGKSVQ